MSEHGESADGEIPVLLRMCIYSNELPHKEEKSEMRQSLFLLAIDKKYPGMYNVVVISF